MLGKERMKIKIYRYFVYLTIIITNCIGLYFTFFRIEIITAHLFIGFNLGMFLMLIINQTYTLLERIEFNEFRNKYLEENENLNS